MNVTFSPIDNNFFVSYVKSKTNSASPFHYHNGYEMYFLLDGKRNYLTHNNIFSLSPGCVTLTKPHYIHGTNGDLYERIVINFTNEFLEKYFLPETIKRLTTCFSVHMISSQITENTPRIKELFLQIHQISESENENKDLLLAFTLAELLTICGSLVNDVTTDNYSSFPKKIQEIIQYLSDNISTVRNLDQIAEKFYISKYHLSHLFKSQTGFSLIDFLIKTKISHSMHLLQNTDKSVVEISELCGFESSSYFCIAFKDKLKMTPLAYRKLVQTKK